MSKVAGLREEIIAKQKAIATVFASKPDKDFTDEEVSDLRQKNAELNDLGAALEVAIEIEGIGEKATKGAMQFPATPAPTQADPPQRKSLGELFVESQAYKAYSKADRKGPASEIDLATILPANMVRFGLKAVLNETGFAPEAVRTGEIITPGAQMPVVADLFAQGRTSQNAIVYMEETTTTNAAAETDESGAKPESTLAFTERSSSVRKIATVLPVTDELLQDAPAMQDYVNSRLAYFVQAREDSQLLVGDGNAPNLRGILNVVGIQTQAKGADPTPDAFYKGIVKIATGAFLPADGAIVNPLDWQDIRLLRTTDGVYIYGSPLDPGVDRMWGVRVVVTTAITQNTGLVGNFRAGAQIYRRSDLAFAVSDQHSDFFVKNQLMIRAEERLALVAYRPAAFCTITGI